VSQFYQLRVLLCGICVIIFCTVSAQEPTRFLSWNDGLNTTIGAKQNYQGKFGGRVLFDMASFHQRAGMEDKYGGLENSHEWRRIRLQHSGKFSRFKYKLQLELAKEHMLIEDMYVEAGRIPVLGNIRVGHMKEPFLFEAQTSSNDVLFMERSVTTMFSSGRNLGIMVHNRIAQSDWYWSVGAFRNGLFDVVGVSRHIGYNFCGRLSGLIAKSVDMKKIAHVGVGLKQSTFDQRTFEVSSRPESHLAHKYISSGALDGVRNASAVSFELALQSGRASLQSEMVQSFTVIEVEGRGNTVYAYPACMAQVSYFLTRDTHTYKDGNSGFGSVTPVKSLFNGGIGAVELAARHSRADLSSGGLQGGALSTSTLGINWYPNSIARITANYIHANVVGIGGTDIWQMRFQFAL